jgi:deoxyribodipyrimidine photo-lyase
VESNVVVPVELASDKRESAARTLRPKIRRHLDEFLVELEPTEIGQPSLDLEVEGLDLSGVDAILDGMSIDKSVEPLRHLYTGGLTAAKEKLEEFIENRLDEYAEHRNQPQTDHVSHMSKYLHFGHISPVYVALRNCLVNSGRDEPVTYAPSHDTEQISYRSIGGGMGLPQASPPCSKEARTRAPKGA